MKSQNVYIIGKAKAGNRNKNLLKILLDGNRNIYYNSFIYNKEANKNLFKSLVETFLVKMNFIAKKLSNLYFLSIADVVILPAMGNRYQIEFNLAKFFKKIIITDYYISFYDTYVLDRDIIKIESKEALKLKKYDFNLIKSSNYTIFLNKTEANYYLNLVDLPFNPSKHKVVPLCVEETIKCDLNYFFKETVEDKTFNICWWGTYIPLHGLEKIIQAAKILESNYDLNFHLFLFGNDDEKSLPYIRLINNLKISENITLENNKTFSNEKLPQFLVKKCDLVLGNFGDSEKAKNVLVNKLIEGISMKAPVLTGESVAPHEFFTGNEIYYSQNDPESIAQKIYNISKEDKLAIKDRIERSYFIYKDSFSINAYEKKMNDVFRNV